MTDALLLRPVPQRRHCLADAVLAARRVTVAAAGEPDHITTWWELVDPAAADDDLPLGLVATRHRPGGLVEIVHLVLAAGAALQGTDDLGVRLLRSLVDVLRVGSPARMLCAPVPVPDGLCPDDLVAAGFVAAGPVTSPADQVGALTDGYVVEL